MRILHVAEYAAGGLATYLREVVSYQAKSLHIDAVRIVCAKEKLDPNLKDYCFHTYNYKRKKRYILSAINSIRRSIKLFNPDIIHVHSTFAGVFVRSLYLFKFKRPKIIYCAHGWVFQTDAPKWKMWFYGKIEQLLGLATDLIVNISHFEYDMSMQFGLPQNKSVVIYSGISNKKLLADKSCQFSVDATHVNLLFVGRFDRSKGLDILLDIFRDNQFSGIKLYVAGELVVDSQNISIPSNVTALGWVDHSTIDKYYQAVDAVIIPSRWEGFGLVAVEAMKNRRAVIASNAGALPELVNHGVTGYIFDMNDTCEILHILQSLTKDTLEKMGGQGYERFVEEFNADRMNEQLLSYYIDLFQQNNHGTKGSCKQAWR